MKPLTLKRKRRLYEDAEFTASLIADDYTDYRRRLAITSLILFGHPDGWGTHLPASAWEGE